MKHVLLSLALGVGSMQAVAADITEMATPSLFVRGLKAEVGADGIERFTYSIRNTTNASVHVMLMLDSLGMCTEYEASTVRIGTAQEAVRSGERDGVLLRPGQEAHQSIKGGRDCIRPNDILNFVGFFLVRNGSGQVRAERFALGNFYAK